MTGPVPRLNEQERDEAEALTTPGAPILHEVIRREGEEELARSSSALAWSGFLAGMTIGFSLVSEGVLRTHLPEAPWSELLAKLGFPVGFIFVILGRQQLFTENTLLPIIPLLVSRSRKTLRNVARLWAVVLLSNIAGACVFAWILAKSSLFDERARGAFSLVGRMALEGGFGEHLIKGVFAGWMIALVVWLLGGMKSRGAGIIFVVTYVMGVSQLKHIVSGSVDVLFLVLSGAATWTAYLENFAVPVLLGNVIGGLTMVAIANHAQVVAGGGRRP